MNYRADPAVIQRILPSLFRPKLHRGFAIAGICLIRLKQMRPKVVPLPWGMGSENAAHRIAVTWQDDGIEREGVFIPRRDTSSRFNTLVGGRLFPGEHHHAQFHVEETAERLELMIESDDDEIRVIVKGRLADGLPRGSVFRSLQEASDFFAAGSLGYSVTSETGRYDGLELACKSWQVTPLTVEQIESSFYDDRSVFPSGSIEFDCGLLMRGIKHEWHSQKDLCCASTLMTL